MTGFLKKAHTWWKAEPHDLGIAHVPLDSVDPAPAPNADEATEVRTGFIQSILAMERQHARTMDALSEATINQVRG